MNKENRFSNTNLTLERISNADSLTRCSSCLQSVFPPPLPPNQAGNRSLHIYAVERNAFQFIEDALTPKPLEPHGGVEPSWSQRQLVGNPAIFLILVIRIFRVHSYEIVVAE